MYRAIPEEMNDCRARLWSFTASHDRLALEIQKEGDTLIYVDDTAAIRCKEISVFDQPE